MNAMPRSSAQGPLPGTRWVRRVGKHAGAEVEVERTNDQSVFFKNLGGGTAMGNQKLDQSQVHSVLLSSFKSMYTAKRELALVDGHGGASFRRKAAPQPAVVDDLPPVSPPLQLNGYILRGKTNFNIEVLEITPDMAKAWLARGGINRKPTARLVARIAAAIRRGEWQLTGDSIKLDEEQRVLDGQHRLLAIVEAGIPVTSLVVRNVQVEAQDVIDTGRSRNPGDVLSMHGFRAAPMGIAAAVRILLAIEHFGHPNVSSRQLNLLISNAVTLRYAQEHPELVEAVLDAQNLRKAIRLGGGDGLLGAFITLIRRANAEAAEWFIGGLESGANLEADSPILKLRTRLLSERNEGRGVGHHGQADREALLAMCLKAWNAWRHNDSMRVLVWRESEGFPVAAK